MKTLTVRYREYGLWFFTGISIHNLVEKLEEVVGRHRFGSGYNFDTGDCDISWEGSERWCREAESRLWSSSYYFRTEVK